MAGPGPHDYCHVVDVGALGPGGATYRLAPTAEQRRDLAGRLGLLDLPSLVADATVERADDGVSVRVTLYVVADVVQSCVVSLDPLPARIEERIDLIYTPATAGTGEGGEIVVTLEDDVPEPLVGDRIDLGAATIEHLALALDPYPRKPGLVFEPEPQDSAVSSPFAVLERLKQPTKSG
jgi:uncharacterized metal-binding protein YceD (DUF177 family)